TYSEPNLRRPPSDIGNDTVETSPLHLKCLAIAANAEIGSHFRSALSHVLTSQYLSPCAFANFSKNSPKEFATTGQSGRRSIGSAMVTEPKLDCSGSHAITTRSESPKNRAKTKSELTKSRCLSAISREVWRIAWSGSRTSIPHCPNWRSLNK